ncbi:adenosine deaminase [Stylonychia lemnae]|uniref:tRNA-specific adenosine deaminase 1 n=1 Tax=Stylonychia lemnae TaxID=5949 RepID=A0A078B7P0_STYLE|nr:adenosine deaminase [Stylonychia lemnae]|eukprot:CDW90525.1 adenosine deaminase [Stylonychia lemnae]
MKNQSTSKSVDLSKIKNGQFYQPLFSKIRSLNENILFHLYVSEPPCGDSSLLLKDDSNSNSHWTGAKSTNYESCQDLGISRLKSGRSDIKDDNRSECMSCSDKIMMWNTLGIQGSLLAPSGSSMAWNITESDKLNLIIGKFGIKQGGNIKNVKALKSFKSDICKYSMLELLQRVLDLDLEKGKQYNKLKEQNIDYFKCKEQLISLLKGGWTNLEFKRNYEKFFIL